MRVFKAGAQLGARFALLGLIALTAYPVQADEKAAVQRMRAERLAADGRCDDALDALGHPGDDDPATGLLRGRCLINLQRYVEAIDTLDVVATRDPDLPGLELERGIALYHMGDLDGARTALAKARDASTEDDPRLDLYEGLLHLQAADHEQAAIALERSRGAGAGRVDPIASFYAGVAWANLEERERAEDSLRRVIEMDPDGPWGAEAQRLLNSRATAVQGGKPWVLARVGMEYDSNVVLTRTSALPQDISDKDGTRGTWYFEAGSELFREGSWSGGAIVSYDGNAHIESRVQDFNTHYPVLSGWIDNQLDRNHRLRLRYDIGFAWVDEKEYLFGHDVTLSGLRYWGAAGETELFVGFDYDDYLFDLQNEKIQDQNGNTVTTANVRRLDRDGSGISTGFNHYMPLMDDRVIARAGYAFERYWADGAEYSGLAHTFSVGYVATLPFEVDWDAGASFRYEPFSNRSIFPIDTNSNGAATNPSDDRSRLDKTWEFATSLSKAITDHVSVSAAYSYADVNSNVPVYSYDRHIVGGYVTVRLQ